MHIFLLKAQQMQNKRNGKREIFAVFLILFYCCGYRLFPSVLQTNNNGKQSQRERERERIQKNIIIKRRIKTGKNLKQQQKPKPKTNKIKELAEKTDKTYNNAHNTTWHGKYTVRE